jgi:hypothetical protein
LCWAWERLLLFGRRSEEVGGMSVHVVHAARAEACEWETNNEESKKSYPGQGRPWPRSRRSPCRWWGRPRTGRRRTSLSEASEWSSPCPDSCCHPNSWS